MKTYTVLYAEDVPIYGSAEIEAENDEAAIALAHDMHAAGKIVLDDISWNASVCHRIVSIQDDQGNEIADDISLDGTFLRDGGDAARDLCDAAPELLEALEYAHAEVLKLAKERDPDQLGMWDAIFAPAKNAIAKARRHG